MRREAKAELERLRRSLNPEDFRPVRIDEVREGDRPTFRKRKRMLDLFWGSDRSATDIARLCETSRNEVYRIARRSLFVLPGGAYAGELACVLQCKIVAPVRIDRFGRGTAGKRAQFFVDYPAIKTRIDEVADQKRKMGHLEFHARAMRELWRVFEAACREAGVDTEHDYPFTNKDHGRAMLRDYVKKRRGGQFSETVKVEHGRHVGRIAASASIDAPGFESSTPYSRVVFDGHRLDTHIVVHLTNHRGDRVTLPSVRPWVLVAIDVCSRAVIGYSVCVTKEYSMHDVLTCIASIYEPWSPRDLPPGVAYPPSSGLPSGLIEGCAYRAIDQLRFDNALSHVSPWLQDRLLRSGVTEVVTSAARNPHSNPIPESLFGHLEAATFHRWPTTTGSGPSDPRRKDPERAAIALEFDIDDLTTVIDLAVAKYNASVHEELGGQSPLEYLERRVGHGADLVRHVAHEDVDGLGLFERDHAVTVRGDLKSGHHPYVNFCYVRYTGAELAGQPALVGQKASLRLDTRDIRSGLLFIGARCIGRVQVPVRWRARRHDVAVRRAVQQLTRDRRIAERAEDPVGDYYLYLEARAQTSRSDRARLLKATTDPTDPVDAGAPTSGNAAEAPSERSRRRIGQPGYRVLTKSITR